MTTKAHFIKAGHLKQEFLQSTCVVPISVGQEYHEGSKFKATLELINTYFKACTIMVCDTLQRHNLESCGDDDVRYQESAALGKEWMKRNAKTISQLTIPHEIVFWDTWLRHPIYEKRHALIEEFYKSDEKFQFTINETIYKFLSRKLNENNTTDFKKAFNFSLKYLQEEMTVMPLWVEQKFAFEIYPKERPPAMQLAYEKFVQPKYPNLLRRIALKFKKKEMTGEKDKNNFCGKLLRKNI